MTQEEPRHVLVQARRKPSPLYEAPAGGWWAEDTSAFSANLALEDPALAQVTHQRAGALRGLQLAGGEVLHRPLARKEVDVRVGAEQDHEARGDDEAERGDEQSLGLIHDSLPLR